MEAIARKMMEDNWLICFDEVQHTDYGSSVLMHQLFAYMLSRGEEGVGSIYMDLCLFYFK